MQVFFFKKEYNTKKKYKILFLIQIQTQKKNDAKLEREQQSKN